MHIVICPHCGRQLKLKNAVEQAQLQCRFCMKLFVGSTQAPPPEEYAEVVEVESDDPVSNPTALSPADSQLAMLTELADVEQMASEDDTVIDTGAGANPPSAELEPPADPDEEPESPKDITPGHAPKRPSKHAPKTIASQGDAPSPPAAPERIPGTAPKPLAMQISSGNAPAKVPSTIPPQVPAAPVIATPAPYATPPVAVPPAVAPPAPAPAIAPPMQAPAPLAPLAGGGQSPPPPAGVSGYAPPPAAVAAPVDPLAALAAAGDGTAPSQVPQAPAAYAPAQPGAPVQATSVQPRKYVIKKKSPVVPLVIVSVLVLGIVGLIIGAVVRSNTNKENFAQNDAEKSESDGSTGGAGQGGSAASNSGEGEAAPEWGNVKRDATGAPIDQQEQEAIESVSDDPAPTPNTPGTENSGSAGTGDAETPPPPPPPNEAEELAKKITVNCTSDGDESLPTITGEFMYNGDKPLESVTITAYSGEVDIKNVTCENIPPGGKIRFSMEVPNDRISLANAGKVDARVTVVPCSDPKIVMWAIKDEPDSFKIENDSIIKIRGPVKNFHDVSITDIKVYADFFTLEGRYAGSAEGTLDSDSSTLTPDGEGYYKVTFDADKESEELACEIKEADVRIVGKKAR